jgi:hypothetical protein
MEWIWIHFEQRDTNVQTLARPVFPISRWPDGPITRWFDGPMRRIH